MDDLGTILGVWAHPDDETYLTAGLMARAARAGGRVVCVTATKGEGGSWDEKRWPSATMGEVRAKELIDSLNLLGVTEHHWLDYIDGMCADVPTDEAVAKVEKFIREVEPDTVLTFGTDGMTGHPDHKAVSAWTTEAFRAAAKPGAKLYYAAVTPDYVREYVPRWNKFDVFAPGTPDEFPRDDIAIYYEVPPDLLDLKVQAVEKHVSQVEYMWRYFGRDFFVDANKIEMFRLVDEKA